MYSPERMILRAPWLQIWLHCKSDKRWEYVTWREKLNPLRYSITFFPGRNNITINRNAVWNRRLANLLWVCGYKYIWKWRRNRGSEG